MKEIMLKDIITHRLATVAMDDALETIQEIFEKAHFHHLVMYSDEDKVVGLISDRDLLKNRSPFLSTASEQRKDRDTLKKKAH